MSSPPQWVVDRQALLRASLRGPLDAWEEQRARAELARLALMERMGAALRTAGPAMHEVLTEFVSKSRACNWQIVNESGVEIGQALAAYDQGPTA